MSTTTTIEKTLFAQLPQPLLIHLETHPGCVTEQNLKSCSGLDAMLLENHLVPSYAEPLPSILDPFHCTETLEPESFDTSIVTTDQAFATWYNLADTNKKLHDLFVDLTEPIQEEEIDLKCYETLEPESFDAPFATRSFVPPTSGLNH